MRTLHYPIILLLAFLLTACSNNASHLPNVFQLPGAVIGSAVDNAVYNSRHKKVATFVNKHYLEIREDVVNGGGATLTQAMQEAEIPASKHAQVRQQLIADQAQYFNPYEEAANQLMHRFAALYPVSKENKTINGFSYPRARNLISEYANKKPEILRQAIQAGHGAAWNELSTLLNINAPTKRQQFSASAQSSYALIYIEPLVVFFMVQK